MDELFLLSYNTIQDNEYLDSNSNYYSIRNSDSDKDYYYYLPNLVHLVHINHTDCRIVERNYIVDDDDDYWIRLLE
jgi:hypothetical protein